MFLDCLGLSDDSNNFLAKLDGLTRTDLTPAARFYCSIDENLAVFDHHLGMTARGGKSGNFEELGKFNVFCF